MAFSANLVKEHYKSKSVEELEKMYADLKSDFYFETLDDQIAYLLKNFMNASYRTNVLATREGLEALLKEKTGKDYSLEEKFSVMHLSDLIDYISKNSNLPFDKTLLINFFDKVTADEEDDEDEKAWFLVCIIQDRENFNNFIKDVKENSDANAVFEKHCEIANTFYYKNSSIG